jgi:dTDP-4-amino-4,6-dideoxygalactose transaminase
MFPQWPFFEQDEIAAVVAVLESGKVNYWTGDEVRHFEKEFSSLVGVDYAIALSNGTVALEAALKALGIGPGDEVIVTPRTFIASASCAALQGAKPVFVDVDYISQNINPENIENSITSKTKAIIAVHLAGWPCDMESILRIGKKYGLKIIEDCAQAHGAKYKGKHVGSFGDVATFSFCQDKIMTTGGEGGMLVTNDRLIWKKTWEYKDHGKSYDAVNNREHSHGFKWLHESFGTNWRMTEMQAAIGLVQLRKLEKWVEIRRRNACILTERLSGFDSLRITTPPPEIFHSYYKYYVFVQPDKLKPGWDRDRIMNAIVENGIPCFSGSCSEIYLEKAFTMHNWQPSQRLPIAKELGETSLMFLVHPTLSEPVMFKTATVAERTIKKATK